MWLRYSPAHTDPPSIRRNAHHEHHAPARAFHFVFAATAWHWLDPAVKYRRAWQQLRPGGHLAFWSAEHVVPAGGDPFFAGLQDVYDEIGEGLPPGATFRRPAELADASAEIKAAGLFGEVTARLFDWEISYTADEYIRLLDTFSGHIAMAGWQLLLRRSRVAGPRDQVRAGRRLAQGAVIS